MFKRRKPEDEPEPTVEPSSQTASSPGPITSADNGLGVPPRPPTAVSPAQGTPAQGPNNKDPIMGRPPFATPTPAPTASGNAPMPPATPPRPPGPPTPPSARIGEQKPAAVQERRTLVVGRGISVQGMVQDAERLVVEGTVEATMIHAAELAVSLGGIFKGEVEVDMAEVAGTIDGTLTAKSHLIVRASGVVLGTARCRKLQVEEGGQITGRIEMLTDGARSSMPPSANTVRTESARNEAAETRAVMSYES